MIQLTIEDNMRVTFIVGKQRIFCDRITIDVESGHSPDIRIDGLNFTDVYIDHDMEE